MTTYVAIAGRKGRQASNVGFAGDKKTAFGTVTLGADVGTATLTDGPKAGDLYHMCKIPAGAIIIGGRLFGSRAASGTSAGSTLLQWAIGLQGEFKDVNLVSYGTYASGASALGLVSVDYQRISGLQATDNTMNFNLGGLLYSVGPIKCTGECIAVVQSTVSGTSFISASTLSLDVEYYMDSHT